MTSPGPLAARRAHEAHEPVRSHRLPPHRHASLPAREEAHRGAGARAPLRVLLADAHPVFRAGLRAVIAGEPDLEVVGEAGDLREAAALLPELRPDVVALDPGGADDGPLALGAALPGTRVLLLTARDDPGVLAAAARRGARGFAPRDADPEDLLEALRVVGRGGAVFGPGVADGALALVARSSSARERFPGLSAREEEVLERLARGHGTARIAQELFIAPKTVRNHVSNLCGKLGVADRVGAALRARELGLGVEAELG